MKIGLLNREARSCERWGHLPQRDFKDVRGYYRLLGSTRCRRTFVIVRFIQRLSLTLALSRWERGHSRPHFEQTCHFNYSPTQTLVFRKCGDQYSLFQRERARVRENALIYLWRSFRKLEFLTK